MQAKEVVRWSKGKFFGLDRNEKRMENVKRKEETFYVHHTPGGGALTLTCRPQDLLFRPHLALEQAFFPLQRLPLRFFEKCLCFKTNFANFQLLRHKFQQNFIPETPVSSQNIISGDTIFESPDGTYLPTFLATTPPPRPRPHLAHCSLKILIQTSMYMHIRIYEIMITCVITNLS